MQSNSQQEPTVSINLQLEMTQKTVATIFPMAILGFYRKKILSPSLLLALKISKHFGHCPVTFSKAKGVYELSLFSMASLWTVTISGFDLMITAYYSLEMAFDIQLFGFR